MSPWVNRRPISRLGVGQRLGLGRNGREGFVSGSGLGAEVIPGAAASSNTSRALPAGQPQRSPDGDTEQDDHADDVDPTLADNPEDDTRPLRVAKVRSSGDLVLAVTRTPSSCGGIAPHRQGINPTGGSPVGSYVRATNQSGEERADCLDDRLWLEDGAQVAAVIPLQAGRRDSGVQLLGELRWADSVGAAMQDQGRRADLC
jgi:hypothetical protein